MVSGKTNTSDFAFDRTGFSAFSGRPDPFQRHRHNEIELAVFDRAPVTAFYNGRRQTVQPNRLVVLWGVMPHHAVEVPRRAIGHGIRIPLAWFLQWDLPQSLVQRLMTLGVVIAPPQSVPCSDLALVKHWVALEGRSGVEARTIVLLEAEARLRRLVMGRPDIASRKPAGPRETGADGSHLFEHIIGEIAEHYREPLSVPSIARKLGVSRNHVMRVFRRYTGTSVLEYLTDQRVSCAQSLLATTDRKVLDLAYECGFGSSSRFYAAFVERVGVTPLRYRRSLHENIPA